MKRPIPEGVNLPHQNAIIMGWGGEFEVPERGEFNGFIFHGDYPHEGWDLALCHGKCANNLYAADAGSEVALLNRNSVPLNSREPYSSETGGEGLNQEDPLMNAVFGAGNCRGDIAFGNHCGDCERCKSYGWTKEDPRDGAIRTDLERNLLGLLFLPRYRDMSLDQIRTLASGYVTQGNNLERTEAEIREFITDALKTPRLERR